MDSSHIVQLVSIIILVCLSAFFSSAETALVTVNKVRIRMLAENGDKRAKKVLKITGDNGKMLSAILIGNNIVNLSASSIATLLATDLFNDAGPGIATGAITFLVLIFGEVAPKTMATIKADYLALRIAGIIEFLMIIFTPLIFVIDIFAKVVLFIFHVNPNDVNNVMTEEEIRTIVDESQESGVIEDEERDMIHNVFDFGDSEAKEVMVPRINMSFVHADATFEELLSIIRKDKFTRIPVYEESIDNVIGILNVKDLLLLNAGEEFSIRKLMREPYFTYEHKNSSDLFIEMRKSSISIAIVLDEYGVTAGLVTLEDLLEEIVGEIRDEYDTDEVDSIITLSTNEFEVLGSTNLDDVSAELKVNFQSDAYDSIGGFCLERLEHLPENDEIIYTEDGVLLKILEVDKNRIEKVYIKLPDETTEPEEE